ncbi:MAG: DNA double-strand break repair nuclease NurA [Desulfurococcus sp.]|nr:DNA double-strand break repair nuclease NurA [Desulfurococcus sp.]
MVARKISRELDKIRVIRSKVRRLIEERSDLFHIGVAGEPLKLCFEAVDSGFTAPAIELLGGYLAVINVVSVRYGSTCSRTQVSARTHVNLWFNEDETGLMAKVLERKRALELLEARRLALEMLGGKPLFDVLLLDGEIAPRITYTVEHGRLRRNLEKFINLSRKLVESALSSATPVVGVLKRSYARDIAVTLGLTDIRINDRVLMSLALKPGEYLIVKRSEEGVYGSLSRALREIGKSVEDAEIKRWVNSRLKWYEGLMSALGDKAREIGLGFYRPPGTLYPVATKVEYVVPEDFSIEKLFSSIMYISTSTGIPAPIDQADALSAVTRELRHIVYEKLKAEVAGNLGVEDRDLLLVLSLMNPEKLLHLIG